MPEADSRTCCAVAQAVANQLQVPSNSQNGFIASFGTLLKNIGFSVERASDEHINNFVNRINTGFAEANRHSEDADATLDSYLRDKAGFKWERAISSIHSKIAEHAKGMGVPPSQGKHIALGTMKALEEFSDQPIFGITEKLTPEDCNKSSMYYITHPAAALTMLNEIKNQLRGVVKPVELGLLATHASRWTEEQRTNFTPPKSRWSLSR